MIANLKKLARLQQHARIGARPTNHLFQLTPSMQVQERIQMMGRQQMKQAQDMLDSGIGTCDRAQNVKPETLRSVKKQTVEKFILAAEALRLYAVGHYRQKG